jgi:hypothetical protein
VVDDPHETTRMSDQLAAIRVNLARMRAESRASLRRLAATREAADVSQAAREGEQRPVVEPGAPH